MPFGLPDGGPLSQTWVGTFVVAAPFGLSLELPQPASDKALKRKHTL
jgi:hypothetical protein